MLAEFEKHLVSARSKSDNMDLITRPGLEKKKNQTDLQYWKLNSSYVESATVRGIRERKSVNIAEIKARRQGDITTCFN